MSVGSESSESLCGGSQQSNFSNCSEMRREKVNCEKSSKSLQIMQLENLFLELKLPFPADVNGPLDPKASTYNTDKQARLVANIFSELCNLFLVGSDIETKNKFLSKVVKAFHNKEESNVELAVSVLSSLRDYLDLIGGDETRDGKVARKMFFESLTGPAIRDGNLISQLASFLSARKNSMLDSAKCRKKLEDSKKLVPFINRLGRKPPEGEKVIPIDWKVKAARWYETDSVSDIIKGHNNIRKEKFKSCDGDKLKEYVILHPKRVLQVPVSKLLQQAILDISWP